MVSPLGRPLARRTVTQHNLREEFLAHFEAPKLRFRDLEWYADRTRRFADWCVDRQITTNTFRTTPDKHRRPTL